MLHSDTENPPEPAPREPKTTKEVSVMGWIEDPFGMVLMIKQKRRGKLWSLPGGKVKAKESLTDAVFREIHEETGYHVRSAIPCGFFDRPEKMNLTVLFKVRLMKNPPDRVRTEEIETMEFRANPPRNSTPSLRHFWESQRGR